VIPDEAVEAAWWAMPKESYVDSREHVRAMLEAAAPHMTQAAKAEAWQEGYENGLKFGPPRNPHRKAAK